MQSTPNPNFDDAFDKIFTDEAWKNMNVLLDREMPIEKNRKRGLLIWWTNGYTKCIAAGIALLLCIGVWRTFMNTTPIYEATHTMQDSTKQSATATKSHEPAHVSILSTPASTSITTNQYDHEAANLPTKKRLNSAIAIFKHQEYDHKNILITPKTNFNSGASPVLPIANDPISPIIVHKKIDTVIAVANSKQKNDAEKAISTSSLEAVNIHTLPALPLALLENTPLKNDINEEATATMPQKKRWWKQDVKASIYSIFNSHKSLVGGELGIAKSFRLSDKTALFVGISGMRRSYRVALSDSSTAIVPNAKTAPISSNVNTTYFVTNIAMNSLQIPIVFSRSMSKHWSLGVGITPLLNLTQRNSSVAEIQTQSTPVTKSFSTNTQMSDVTTQADWYIKDMPAIPATPNSHDAQSFQTHQIQQNLRRLNVLSGLYATYTVEKVNIVGSVEYNLLSYNRYNNTGHSFTMKVGVERNF